MTLESPERPGVDGANASLEISLPVAARDCARLSSRLGGGCDGAGGPLEQQPEILSVQSLTSPLQAVMHLEGRGSFDISHAGSGGGARPTEWTLVQHAAAARVEIGCQPGDRLLLVGTRGSARATCGRFGPEYSLRTTVERRSSPHLHLNGVHWLRAHLLGDAGTATVEEGELILRGRVEPVSSPEPEEVAFRAEAPHLVTLDVDAPRPDAPPHVSLRTKRAAAATGDGHRLPTWIETHPEIAYLVIGALAGIFLTAVFDHLVTWWRR